MADITPTKALDNEVAAPEANGQIAGDITVTQADEDTKFQKAISVWRSRCAR
jgi:hypothetical protein